MNLYLISQDKNDNYDTYDSAVVAANSEYEARRIDPSGYRIWDDSIGGWLSGCFDDKIPKEKYDHCLWVNDIESIKVELIGKYNGDKSGVILASFNAG